MNELSRFYPSRRSLSFDEVVHEHSDEFYEFHFSKLFVEIYTLVSVTFCPEQSTTCKFPPWIQEFPEEFVKYVELVARSDPSTRNWDRLLRDRTERKYLLQAIIMRVIDAQVFSSLIFGADSGHRKILESTDASLVNAEGFRRSSLRAQTNRLYMGTKRGQPPLFWQEVDTLCTQLLALLMPVYTWATKTEGWPAPEIPKLYQWLHDVISYAAWLNVCIRMSPAIIAYDWVAPGERYRVDQINLSQEVYEVSKESAKMHHRQDKKNFSSPKFKMAARVKISVGPEIIRYKPAMDAIGAPGMEAYTIMKPHVVYYHGQQSDSYSDRAYISLPDYIRKVRDRNTVPRGTAFLISVVVICFYLWVKFQPSEQHAWLSIKQGLSPTSESEFNWSELEV